MNKVGKVEKVKTVETVKVVGKKKKFAFFTVFTLLTLFTAGTAFAQNLTELVDIPTADILESGSYNVNLRMYNAGSVLTRLLFSVKFFELGAYLDTQNATGKEGPKANDVQPLVKIKLPIEGLLLPAIAFGYDGQGEFYYFKEPRGFYVVLTKEMLLPGLQLHVGGNSKEYSYGFAGLSYSIDDIFHIFAEYDRIRNLRETKDNRLNAGMKIQITDDLGMGLDFRNIGERGDEHERILRFDYTGAF